MYWEKILKVEHPNAFVSHFEQLNIKFSLSVHKTQKVISPVLLPKCLFENNFIGSGMIGQPI